MSIRHPFSTFNNLIFEKDPCPVYLSYHITSTRGDRRKVNEINKFRSLAHALGEKAHAAVLDPVTIDELALRSALDGTDRRGKTVRILEKHRWDLGAVAPLADGPAWPIDIPKHEVEEVLDTPHGGGRATQSDVANQITSRDFHLVEIAKYLAVYRPIMEGQASRGVDAEIKHAVEHGRKVIAYHSSADRAHDGPSTHPFDNRITVMPTRAKLLDHLKLLLTRRARRLAPAH